MDNTAEYKWNWIQSNKEGSIRNGDIRVVNLPIEVIFEWSDEIVADYDFEAKKVLEYKSGWVMRLVDNQKFVYNGEDTVFLANAAKMAR